MFILYLYLTYKHVKKQDSLGQASSSRSNRRHWLDQPTDWSILFTLKSAYLKPLYNTDHKVKQCDYYFIWQSVQRKSCTSCFRTHTHTHAGTSNMINSLCHWQEYIYLYYGSQSCCRCSCTWVSYKLLDNHWFVPKSQWYCVGPHQEFWQFPAYFIRCCDSKSVDLNAAWCWRW